MHFDLSKLPKTTNSVYLPLYTDRSRHLLLRGGAGSGKSHFVAQKVLFRLVTEEKHRIAVFRKYRVTVKDSVWSEIKSKISDWGWSDQFEFNKSSLEMTFRPNGNQILFKGLDDSEKLKSIHKPSSMWLEEATEFTEDDYTQLNLRMRGESQNYFQIISTFNPVSSQHWIKKRFFDYERDDARTLVTTYKHNAYLDDQYKSELESLSDTSPQHYKIYVQGEWGSYEGQIFRWEFSEPPSSRPRVAVGVDFGYNNPTAVVLVTVHDDVYYVKELLYKRHLTVDDLLSEMQQMQIARTVPVYADSEDPSKIEEMRRAGYNMFGTTKGRGSVKAGIELVQRKKVLIENGSSNIEKERAGYVWSRMKDGTLLDEPIKVNDHLMDAIRYAIQGLEEYNDGLYVYVV